jgi:hypothetical protein
LLLYSLLSGDFLQIHEAVCWVESLPSPVGEELGVRPEVYESLILSSQPDENGYLFTNPTVRQLLFMFHPDFKMWLNEGICHILDIDALDHILFIAALCIAYTVSEWKKTLLLATAFTFGHSITLAAVALGFISVNIRWVEFLITVTIAITAAQRIFQPAIKGRKEWQFYLLAVFFGFIHGMAFGAASIGSLYSNREAIPLVLAFNLGIEGAQLLVVGILLLVSYVLTRWCKIPVRYWQLSLSSCILVYALYLTVKHIPF